MHNPNFWHYITCFKTACMLDVLHAQQHWLLCYTLLHDSSTPLRELCPPILEVGNLELSGDTYVKAMGGNFQLDKYSILSYSNYSCEQSNWVQIAECICFYAWSDKPQIW